MKLRLLTIAALAAGTAFAPAAHATNVTVTFGLSVGTYLPTGGACTLSVPSGADGVTVLEAAKTAHCIVSYQTVSFGFGRFVTCIDEVCGQSLGADGTYWNMYENGVSTTYGVDDFVANNGDELEFAYQAY